MYFLWFNISRLFLFHTHKTLYIFIYHFHLLYFYLFCYIHLPTTFHAILLKTYFQTKSNIICLQHFKDTYLTQIFSNPNSNEFTMTKEGGTCFFYWLMAAYSFNVKVECCRFCEGYDWFLSLWVFWILVWESSKCILF